MNWTGSICELLNEQHGSADLLESSLISTCIPPQLPLFKNSSALNCEDNEVGLHDLNYYFFFLKKAKCLFFTHVAS